jgi:hypothetical protein
MVNDRRPWGPANWKASPVGAVAAYWVVTCCAPALASIDDTSATVRATGTLVV